MTKREMLEILKDFPDDAKIMMIQDHPDGGTTTSNVNRCCNYEHQINDNQVWLYKTP